MRTILKTLFYLWQLPQNLLGLLFVAILRPEASFGFGEAKVFFATKMRSGISLGKYIFIEAGRGYPVVLCHEYGHCKQSQMLGPFYLLIIGLPSLLWASIYNKHWQTSYYSFYTEKWADRLGGVIRKEK